MVRNIILLLLFLSCASCFPFSIAGVYDDIINKRKNKDVIIDDYSIDMVNSQKDYDTVIVYGEIIKDLYDAGIMDEKEFDANNMVYITALDYYKNNKDISDLLSSLERTVNRYYYIK